MVRNGGNQDARNVLTRKQYEELLEIDKFIKSKGITKNSSEEKVRRFLNEINSGKF